MLEISRLRRIDTDGFLGLVTRLGRVRELRIARTIVVKPNLSSGSIEAAADPRNHIVTDLQFLRDVVVAILELSPRAVVYIAESDSIWNDFAYSKFNRLGLPDCLLLDAEAAKRVTMLDLSRDRLIRVDDERFRYFSKNQKQLCLSETLVNADFVVSLSNSKTHYATVFSGACKNLFGCLPASDKSVYHPRLHEVIHDLTIAISPHLSVVDAFYAMEGYGPVLGHPTDSGYRVFSDDATEADLCAAQCAGIAPARVAYLGHLTRTVGGSERLRQYPVIVPLKEPPPFARAMYTAGVSIQRVGSGLQRYGWRLGCRRSMKQVLRSMVRRISRRARPG